MAFYTASNSPVFTKLFAPLASAYAGSDTRYDCPELTDLDFLEMGVLRCLSSSQTGRDFLQHHADHDRKEVSDDLFFKALKSGRRLANASSVNTRIAPEMASRLNDPYADIPELAGFDLHAGDGHYHAAACHDRRSPAGGKRSPSGHFFMQISI